MGQVKQQFITDDKQTQRSLTALVKKVQQLQAENKKLASESKKGAEEYSDAISDGVKQMGAMITSMYGVQAVTAAVIKGFRDWRDEIEGLGKEHKDVSRDIVRELTQTGDLMAGAELQRAFRATQGATEAQALTAFAGVSAGAPTLSREQRLSLSQQVARQSATGVDLSQLGLLAGEIQRLDESRSSGDVTDLAVSIRAAAGRNIDQVGGQEFLLAVSQIKQATGGSDEQALATALEAVLAAGASGAGTVSALATALNRDVDEVRPGRGRTLTPEQETQNRFARASGAERLEILLGDASLRRQILGEQGDRLGLVSPEDIAARAQSLRRAQTEDAADQQLRQLQGFSSGKRVAFEQQQAAVTDQQTKAIQETEETRQLAEKFIEERVLAGEGSRFQLGFSNFLRAPLRFVGAEFPDARSQILSAVQEGIIPREVGNRFLREQFGEELFLKDVNDLSSGKFGTRPIEQAIEKQTEVIKRGQRNPNVNAQVE